LATFRFADDSLENAESAEKSPENRRVDCEFTRYKFGCSILCGIFSEVAKTIVFWLVGGSMRIDNLQQFVKLRRELTQEKEELSRRLAQINEALGEISSTSSSAAQAVPGQARQVQRGQIRRAGRQPSGGGTSLRELVIQVLREGSKTKEEVLQAVQRRGYRFQTKDPLNSLGVILYGKNPKFGRVDGRFALPGGAAGAVRAKGGGGRRGQLSAAARARIAEAQRKRWAASRKGQGGGQSAQKSAAGGASRKRRLSPAARKAIAEAARRRWAAAKAAGRSRL